ncbi:hypothetical protein C4587_00825 [Candidatus Parcubacteria bacterium]|nr:MAG: hypothetical protein C4587_00825 [Candidatus Parcubacteria bacterium]
MPKKSNEELAYDAAIIERTRECREKRTPWKGPRMAELLGVPYETYKKYESRTAIPPHLYDRFCALVGVSIDYFVTGEEANRVVAQRKIIENIRRTK